MTLALAVAVLIMVVLVLAVLWPLPRRPRKRVCASCAEVPDHGPCFLHDRECSQWRTRCEKTDRTMEQARLRMAEIEAAAEAFRHAR